MINKTTITQVDDSTLLAVRLDPKTVSRLRRVAKWANLLLQDPAIQRGATTSDPEFLTRLERGSLRLESWGSGSDCLHAIEDIAIFDAHLAASLVARRKVLTPAERTDVKRVLELLAGMLPCLIETMPLPAWTSLMGPNRHNFPGLERIERIYEDLREQTKSPGGFWELRLCDALVLRDLLGLRPHPETRALWQDLGRITKTHRDALQKLAETRPGVS